MWSDSCRVASRHSSVPQQFSTIRVFAPLAHTTLERNGKVIEASQGHLFARAKWAIAGCIFILSRGGPGQLEPGEHNTIAVGSAFLAVPTVELATASDRP